MLTLLLVINFRSNYKTISWTRLSYCHEKWILEDNQHNILEMDKLQFIFDGRFYIHLVGFQQQTKSHVYLFRDQMTATEYRLLRLKLGR